MVYRVTPIDPNTAKELLINALGVNAEDFTDEYGPRNCLELLITRTFGSIAALHRAVQSELPAGTSYNAFAARLRGMDTTTFNMAVNAIKGAPIQKPATEKFYGRPGRRRDGLGASEEFGTTPAERREILRRIAATHREKAARIREGHTSRTGNAVINSDDPYWDILDRGSPDSNGKGGGRGK